MWQERQLKASLSSARTGKGRTSAAASWVPSTREQNKVLLLRKPKYRQDNRVKPEKCNYLQTVCVINLRWCPLSLSVDRARHITHY